MSAIVYVKSVDGKPLHPTTRCAYVRILLKNKKAKVICQKPFQIQLLYKETKLYPEPENKKTILGIDPGRINIGLSTITTDGTEVYSARVETRNKEIPDLMKERKKHRRDRKFHRREKKRRRAKKYGTTTTKYADGRLLPGCEKKIYPKDIKNSEAKFLNRKRDECWVTPSTRQLVQTHINLINHVRSLLPIDEVCFELNKFAFMKLEDGMCKGVDFQNGRLKNYKSKEEFIYARQEGKCCFCNNPIEHYHHILPESKNGSDLPENLIGVCASCHKKIHTGKLATKLSGIKKKYHHLSVLNQAIPFIIKEIKKMGYPDVHLCSGYETHDYREAHNIDKDHNRDAACIVAVNFGIENLVLSDTVYTIKQFRNHNRQKNRAQYERQYCINEKIIAKNRKDRYEQKGLSLASWRKEEFERQKKLPENCITKEGRRCSEIEIEANAILAVERIISSFQPYISQKEIKKQKKSNNKMAIKTTKKKITAKIKKREVVLKTYVKKSIRQKNNMSRILPGAVILFKGKRYILSGTESKKYFKFVGDKKINIL